MKISLNIIQKYIDFALPPTDELVERINQQLGVVEEVQDLGAIYKAARIVRVVECEKHPDADRLSVCQVDAGEDELVQVVCGAPNVHADMWAVWLPPESVVPSTYGDDEPFVLGARKLRGVMSHGMLAAADELAIGSDHEGIVEITEADLPAGASLVAGASFAAVFGLDDTVIDIENKMFTHRPDLFGQLGVARELYAIFAPRTDDTEHTGQRMIPADWYGEQVQFESTEGLALEVSNQAIDKVPRFIAVAMKDVTVKPSPLWLQCELVAMGSKPINNVVDLTNYIMLLTAQPTHAYDYDKLRGNTLSVRLARAGETAELLNGKTYEFTGDDIVIVDGEGVVGLAGIMGGAGSEVSSETRNIVLEVANFDMYAVRKSSMRHGIFTDALTRFNKGQSKLQNDRVLAKLMELMTQYTGATQASGVYDENDLTDETDRNSLQGSQVVGVDFINRRLGLQLSGMAIGNLLRRANFAVYADEAGDDMLNVTAPFWRTDIELPEDIVEEVGRLYGFDKLPRELPRRSMAPAAHNPELVAKQQVRTALARAGGNEVLTYSFVHENVIERASQDTAGAFQLSNALSPELQYYRISVLPSLLDKVYMNIRAGYDEFMLYEIGKAHHNELYGDDGLPQEFGRIASVYVHKQARPTAAYYQSKKTVEYLVASVLPGARVRYVRLDDYQLPDFKPFAQMIAPFDPVRSAVVEIEGKLAGVVGEFRASVAKNFKLPAQSSGFELFVSPFVRQAGVGYAPLSRYPSVQRDVSFRVADSVPYAAVYDALDSSLSEGELQVAVAPLDIYQSAEATHEKTITLRVTMTPAHKTLESQEATAVLEALIARVVSATGAQVL